MMIYKGGWDNEIFRTLDKYMDTKFPLKWHHLSEDSQNRNGVENRGKNNVRRNKGILQYC